MPHLNIVTKKKNWELAVKSLVCVPKNMTVQCREPGPTDVVREYPIHLEFSHDVVENLREDLLNQLRARWEKTQAGPIPDLFGWVQK